MSTSASPDHPPAYRLWLGLNREPFADAVDDEFFLLDEERAQRLNMLYHLIQHSELLLVVLGPRGSGKTSLLHKLVAMGEELWRPNTLRADPMMDPAGLLARIAAGFGASLPPGDPDTLVDALKERLDELARADLMPLLIVDDVHELSAPTLTQLVELSQLTEAGQPLVRMVLFGEPQLKDMLVSEELRGAQRAITHTLEMPRLSEKQTADYLRYRLGVAGMRRTLPLSRARIKRLHKESQGLPAQLNRRARALLQELATGGATTPRGGRARAFAGLALLLAAAGVLTVIATRDTLYRLFSADAPAASESSGPAARVTQPIEPPPPRDGLPEPGDVPSPNPEPVLKPSGESPLAANTEPTGAPSMEQPAIPETLPGAPTQGPAPSPAPESPPVRPSTTGDTLAPPQETAEPVPAEKTPTPAESTPPPVSRSWLGRQDPNRYTLQLLGARDEKAVRDYLREHELGDSAAAVKTRHRDADWYIVVHGSYASKAEARAAAARLPEPLQRAKPWPRRIGDIEPAN